MKCVSNEKLSEMLDGEIVRQEQASIEKHFEGCQNCRTNYAGLKNISGNLKQTLRVSTSADLDEKILQNFQNFQKEKQIKTVSEPHNQTNNFVWFGMPRFAFAAGLILLGLVGISASQLGKVSAGDLTLSLPETPSPQNVSAGKKIESALSKEKIFENDKPDSVKIIEVPVVREKIIKIPVIEEKIVTRTIYIDKNGAEPPKNSPDIFKQNNVALNNSIKSGELMTQTDLQDFQPVSEIKPRITKKEE